MCGIIGQVNNEKPIDQNNFRDMVNTLRSRGPDGSSSKFFDNNFVALGHRRLAIVDLTDAGRQPMCNEDSTIWLVFNGEIYNHASLRVKLSDYGHLFRSKSDSEVILHAYEQWGNDFVKRLRGIFAFGIWDTKNKKLFCARDHLGVKPFYYSQQNGNLLFASQPKAILQSQNFDSNVDPTAFASFLACGVVPDQQAIFCEMSKLPPASTLTYQNGNLTTSNYWSIPLRPTIYDFDQAVEAVRDTVRSSVKAQLMSDVPVATYLSGGIDSSLITSLASQHYANPLHSITVGFEENGADERCFARVAATAANTMHHEYLLTREGSLDLLDEMIEAYDEPYGLGAAFPMTLIAKVTAELGFKVVLAGDGADELFDGYRHYDQVNSTFSADVTLDERPLSYSPNAWFPSLLEQRKRRLFYKNYEPHNAFLTSHQIAKIAGKRMPAKKQNYRICRLDKYLNPDLPPVLAARVLDLKTYLADEILSKVDRATMGFGVEARVPFLDPDLVDLAFKISPQLHRRNGERKAVLKAAARDFLPQEILSTRKKGFSIPLSQWIIKDARDSFRDELLNGKLVDMEIFNKRKLKTAFHSMQPSQVWLLLIAERWINRWGRGQGQPVHCPTYPNLPDQ